MPQKHEHPHRSAAAQAARINRYNTWKLLKQKRDSLCLGCNGVVKRPGGSLLPKVPQVRKSAESIALPILPEKPQDVLSAVQVFLASTPKRQAPSSRVFAIL